MTQDNFQALMGVLCVLGVMLGIWRMAKSIRGDNAEIDALVKECRSKKPCIWQQCCDECTAEQECQELDHCWSKELSRRADLGKDHGFGCQDNAVPCPGCGTEPKPDPIPWPTEPAEPKVFQPDELHQPGDAVVMGEDDPYLARMLNEAMRSPGGVVSGQRRDDGSLKVTHLKKKNPGKG